MLVGRARVKRRTRSSISIVHLRRAMPVLVSEWACGRFAEIARVL
jgi:hypothetical protein